MVESITATVSNTPLTRVTAEQANVSHAMATQSAKAPEAVQAPYVSPYIHVDNVSNQVVLQIRNGETGKVIDQIPNASAMEREKLRIQAAAAQQQQRAAGPAQPHAGQQKPTPSHAQTRPAPSAGFSAFTRQVSALQAAITGGGTGGTVSLSV